MALKHREENANLSGFYSREKYWMDMIDLTICNKVMDVDAIIWGENEKQGNLIQGDSLIFAGMAQRKLNWSHT